MLKLSIACSQRVRPASSQGIDLDKAVVINPHLGVPEPGDHRATRLRRLCPLATTGSAKYRMSTYKVQEPTGARQLALALLITIG